MFKSPCGVNLTQLAAVRYVKKMAIGTMIMTYGTTKEIEKLQEHAARAQATDIDLETDFSLTTWLCNPVGKTYRQNWRLDPHPDNKRGACENM